MKSNHTADRALPAEDQQASAAASETPPGSNGDALSAWLHGIDVAAAQQPERLAVLGDAETLSYGQLCERVTRFCGHLRLAGIGVGKTVGVCLDRGPDSIVAFLAILRLGGIYLPLDSRNPHLVSERLQRARATALITSVGLQGELAGPSCDILLLDELRQNTPAGFEGMDSAAAPLDAASGECPACLLFTSGSTGASNGVVISRDTLARYADALQHALDVKQDDIYLLSAWFTFSASMRQLIAPLTARACIAVAPESALRDPYQLLALMRRWRVSIWDTVPSLWRVVERAVAQERATSGQVMLAPELRLVALTGEPLFWEDVRRWKWHLHDNVTVLNLYSQTESAGTVAIYRVPEGELPEHGPVPLGSPLVDTELLLLDSNGQPTGEGQVGEVYVASDRLADGYAGSPELTHAAFLAGSAVGSGYARVYRSGDLARRQADGALVPCGRRDHRINLRGYRVDLLEVESALLAQPGVQQVVAAADSRGRLVAFVAPAQSATLEPARLRDALQRCLPDYAVPAQIEVLRDMPLLPGGKVDRKALLQTLVQPASGPAPQAQEQTGFEGRVRLIWERVLGYRGAGLDDSFFEKGGDSLSAVSLFLDIEAAFGVRLSPAMLYDAATLRELVQLVRNGGTGARVGKALQWQAGDDKLPIFLVHVIDEHAPHLRGLVAMLDPGHPVYALEAARFINAADSESGAGELFQGYVEAIRQAVPSGPFILLGWSIGGFMAYCVGAECEAGGTPPAGIILLDAPSALLRPKLRSFQQRRVRYFLHYLQLRVRRELEALMLSPREQGERLAWMGRETLRKIRALRAGTPDRRRRSRLQHDFSQSVDQHQPGVYSGDVILFRSSRRTVDERYDSDLGWSQYSGGNLKIVRLPGDHNSMVMEPRNMKLLAGQIEAFCSASSAAVTGRTHRASDESGAAMDYFLAESLKLVDQPFTEREPWINVVTADAIRHFAFGIGDDNPLWLQPDKEAGEDGARLAPPAFLVAARYPVLHGAPVDVPLISLLKDIEYSWFAPVQEGDRLSSSSTLGAVRDVRDLRGHRRIYVDSHTEYLNQQGIRVGVARATVVRAPDQGDFRIREWQPYRYSDEELAGIMAAIESEQRTDPRALAPADYAVGVQLPPIVRGPLTIGDMVCWHAAVGPSYRPGPLGYKDTQAAPQFRVTHPVTGWPIKYMLQHEDVHLAHQRGMPGPFDNGIMRFAWVSPLVTNWMGDQGFLSRLR